MTVRDLINGSLRLIGVLAEGESPSAQAQNDALSALNDFMDSLSTQSLMIYAKTRESFDLVPSQQTYTFGTGGNFNSSRPQLIENAGIMAPGTAPQCEIQMRIMNKDEFAEIMLKTQQSTIPLFLYDDGQYPLTNVNLWPVPSVVTQLILYSWKALSRFSTVDDTVEFPPGYARMLRYNFAIELSAEYGKEPSQSVVAIATSSKAEVKRMNSKPLHLETDPALNMQTRVFNWRTGDTI